MKFSKINKEFQWIGEGVSFQRRGNIHYESFSIGDLKVNIGNFVLVRNDDALDPEDIMSCYVAQVKELFDTGEETDSHIARVKWFSRIPELPQYAIKHLKTIPDVYEVVEEKRSTWSDIIDAETIFQICEVVYLTLEADCKTALSKYEDHPFPVFFCRYILSGMTLRSALKENDTETLKESKHQICKDEVNGYVPVHDNELIKKTVLKKNGISNEKKARYKAALTGNPDFPKVVIKRIDDRILESKNGGVRVFVADSIDDTIEDVTEKLLKKLDLKRDDEYENDLKNRPIIHNLKPYVSSPTKQNVTPIKSVKIECTESDSEVKNCRTPKEKKNITFQEDLCSLNIKFLKKETPVRSSPRKKTLSNSESQFATPTKKFRTSEECDVTENFLKLNVESDEEHENVIKNHAIIHNIKLQDAVSVEQSLTPTKFTKKEVCVDSDLQSKTRTHKARKSITFQKDTCHVRMNSVKEDTSVKNSPRNKTPSKRDSQHVTPKKKARITAETDVIRMTRSGRKVKAVNYSENENFGNVQSKAGRINLPSPSKKKMPRFVLPSCSEDSDSNFSASDDSDSDESSASVCSVDDICISNRNSTRTKKSKKAVKGSTPRSNTKRSIFNLSIPERKTPLKIPQNVLEESRQRLHVSSVPTSLPCREEEYSDIYSFVKGCLCAQTGGCMYISGVPGTGKTATVHEVMRHLEDEKELGEVPIFTFIEVNGMWMTDPYQCYVHIFKSLTGKTIAPQQAADLLGKRFTEPGPKKDAVVLLVDELDRLWTRKQTVMYNLFDWPSKKNSKLVVLAIANTMDLPERMMMNRISSRLGLTRKTFQPYTFKQLQEIIMSRIQELNVFDPDAVQLVSRKVAAVSGDARRALDICRFATEVVKTSHTPKKSKKILVGMEHVDIALQQMFSSPLISAIRSSSRIAKFFFQCMLSEFTRTGIEETTLLKVYQQVVATCRFEGLQAPNSCQIFKICADLATSHLILVDNFRNDLHMKIRLNVSSDDVTYALTLN